MEMVFQLKLKMFSEKAFFTASIKSIDSKRRVEMSIVDSATIDDEYPFET